MAVVKVVPQPSFGNRPNYICQATSDVTSLPTTGVSVGATAYDAQAHSSYIFDGVSWRTWYNAIPD